MLRIPIDAAVVNRRTESFSLIDIADWRRVFEGTEVHAVITLLKRQRWWITRVVALPFHLLVFTILTFFLLRSVPGDPVLQLLGQNATPQAYTKLQKSLGLNGSLWSQLVHYLDNVAHFNLGDSLISGRPVLSELGDRVPATVELALMGLIGTIIFSLIASYVVVLHPRNVVSRLLKAYAQAAGALPEYVLAIAALFLFYTTLHWAPAPVGRLSTSLSSPEKITGLPWLDTVLQGDWAATASMTAHLFLPIAVLVFAQSAIMIKILTSGLEEALDAAPTRFRVASGASRLAVMASIYRRAAPSAVTMSGILFGYLLGGAVIVETLFGFSGMGSYAVNAVNSADFTAMQGFLLVVAGLSLVVFLIVDLLNMVIDPRRRPGVTKEAV
jgi:ABC-type dipeptide/oligopeptide/nickel transport system permease component